MNLIFKKNDFVIIAIILYLMFCSISSILIYIGIIGFIILSILLNMNFFQNKHMIIPKLIIVLLLLQNFYIGVSAHFFRNMSNNLSLLTQVPTIFIVICTCFIFSKGIFKKLDFLFFIYLLLIFIYIFKGNGVLSAELVYVRNFVVFYLAYRVGGYYIDTEEKQKKFLKFILKCAFIAAIFGLIGFLIGKPFYRLIGVEEVYKAKQYGDLINGLPGNFTTVINGVRVNRLASLYYDPVNFSYFMALGCLIAFYLKKYKLLCLLLPCELLTFGKGGILILVLSLFCVSIHQLIRKYNKLLIRNLIIGIIFLFLIVFTTNLGSTIGSSFGLTMHFYGIETALEQIVINPIGHGLGTAGNLLKGFDSNNANMAAETGLLNMAYQIGVLGISIFIILLFKISKKVSQHHKDYIWCQELNLSFIYIPIILVIVSIFQENTFTPQCVIPYMLLCGGFTNMVKNKEVKNEH